MPIWKVYRKSTTKFCSDLSRFFKTWPQRISFWTTEIKTCHNYYKKKRRKNWKKKKEIVLIEREIYFVFDWEGGERLTGLGERFTGLLFTLGLELRVLLLSVSSPDESSNPNFWLIRRIQSFIRKNISNTLVSNKKVIR